MKKLLLLILVLGLAARAFASESTSYISSPEALVSAGASSESTSYANQNSLAANTTGVASSSSYSVQFGFIAASATTTATTTSTTSTTTTTTTIPGAALNNPNPFNPNTGPTQIDYYLDVNSEVDLYLFDATGQLIFKQHYSSGSAGGSLGYNSVSWDGISNFNQVVENGLYFLRIVANGQVVAKGKIAVIK